MSRTVIVGGGLAGLALAAQLRGACTVLEAAPVAGGLCTSYDDGGFTFDHTGHLWHCADASLRAQVEEWLGAPLVDHRRRAGVWFAGALRPYPFQLALHDLPEATARDIILGVLRARAAGDALPATDLDGAARQRLGDGITDHFLRPYLGKLLGCDLRGVRAETMLRFLPLPEYTAILKSYLDPVDFDGYNATFAYPRDGNRRIIDGLCRRVRGLRLRARAVQVDAVRREVRLADGDSVPYDRLVWTAPLPGLGTGCPGAPATEALRAAAIIGLNLGIRGTAPCDRHWVYYPEPEYPFYRVGCYTNFAPACAPAGTYALYVELPAAWWDAQPESVRLPAVYAALQAGGWLRDAADLAVSSVTRLDPAYVIPTAAGEAQKASLLAWLQERGIHVLGRFGEWDYLAMDDVLQRARTLATALNGAD